jgi:hypothetical protein
MAPEAGIDDAWAGPDTDASPYNTATITPVTLLAIDGRLNDNYSVPGLPSGLEISATAKFI